MRDLRPGFVHEVLSGARAPKGSWRLPCQAEGCRGRTTHGKPYCVEHVAMHAYVQEVLAVEAQYRSEKAALRVNPDGLIANEILVHLAYWGERTAARLARELRLTRRVVQRHLHALRRAGRVVVGGKTAKGHEKWVTR